ncbi:SDR family NAD(P)-dependent oxidoreductase [Gordonia sp. (in: high G+C Gram-positive bacteria)]|uniref:SDR family NAD(P)-dependent oxidoreductase n=1 Tax=Gordonia sp. (in: high G+C Gram-positive bacteria) TaxID=84139 RepID=UPI003F9583C9
MPDISEQRTALVTGGSGGIGRAVVERLAADGFRVAFTYHSGRERSEAVLDAVREAGGQTYAIDANLLDVDGMDRLFDRVVADFGAIDVLVHAAAHAVFGSLRSLAAAKHEDYLACFAVNTHALAAALGRCKESMSEGGSVVYLSSLNAAVGLSGSGAYAASKSAGEALIRTAARELGSRRITCNTVQPGLIETESMREVTDDGTLGWYAMQSPLGRIGEPDEVAGLVAHLVSTDASWMTGQTLRLDGGFHP